MASIKSSLISAVSSASNNKKTTTIAGSTVLLYDISSNTVTRNAINITEKTIKIKTDITNKKPSTTTINSKLQQDNIHTSTVDERIYHILNITDIMYSNEKLNTPHFINTIEDISDLGLAILNKIATNEKNDVIRHYGPAIYNDISNSLIFKQSITLSNWETKDIHKLNSIFNKLSQFIPEINEPFPNVVNAFITKMRTS
jgi:hypothetical protein